VGMALRKQPAQRHGDANALADELAALAQRSAGAPIAASANGAKAARSA
jgi:hypothetical protein